MATTHTWSIPVDRPGVAAHRRATVTGAAGTLASFLSGAALPTKTVNSTAVNPNYVVLQAEYTNSDTIAITFDGGQSTPSATLGIQLAAGSIWEGSVPGWMAATDIKCFAFSGTQYLQCRFYWLNNA